MKVRPRLLAPLLVLCAAPVPAPAQQVDSVSRTINQVFKIDERGDAAVEVSFQYSASQWAIWKEEMGNRPDIVLRDMRYSMATAVLENFSLEKDDVQRKALGRIKARAIARYRNAGEFVIDVPKEMKLVTGEKTDWIFSMTNGFNGEIVSQTLQLKLPASAKNVRFSPGGDFDNLSYTLDLTQSHPKGWRNAGIAMLSAGAGLLVISLFTKKKNPLVGGSKFVPPPPPPPTAALPPG